MAVLNMRRMLLEELEDRALDAGIDRQADEAEPVDDAEGVEPEPTDEDGQRYEARKGERIQVAASMLDQVRSDLGTAPLVEPKKPKERRPSREGFPIESREEQADRSQRSLELLRSERNALPEDDVAGRENLDREIERTQRIVTRAIRLSRGEEPDAQEASAAPARARGAERSTSLLDAVRADLGTAGPQGPSGGPAEALQRPGASYPDDENLDARDRMERRRHELADPMGAGPSNMPGDPIENNRKRAPWLGEGGVLTNAPAGLVAAAQNAAAGLSYMSTEEDREARLLALSEDSDVAGFRASPQFRKLQREAEARHKQALKDATAAGEEAKRWAMSTQRVLQLVTPEDMDTLQEGVWSFISSAPPTLVGIGVGIATRNPVIAMSIAGGGGAAMQGGATYLEARRHGASHSTASASATIQGIIELGDALPVGVALKPGSAFLKRVAATMATEAGTEGVQQLLQDFQAYAAYNPEMTLGEAWHNFEVAVVAGALGGAVYGTLGGLAQPRGEEQPAITEDQARSIREQVRAIVDSSSTMEPLAKRAARDTTMTHRLEDGTPVAPKLEDGKPVAGAWVDQQGTVFSAERAEPIQAVDTNATWTQGGVDYEVAVIAKGREKDTARLADGQEVPISDLDLEDDAKVILGLVPAPESAEKAPSAAKPAQKAAPKKSKISVKPDEFKGQSGAEPAGQAKPNLPQTAPEAAPIRAEPAPEEPAAPPGTEPPPPRGSQEGQAGSTTDETPQWQIRKEVTRDKLSAVATRENRKRRMINSEKDTITDAIIKLGGIALDERMDTTGDEKMQKQLPFVGALFRKGGASLDGMAEKLVEYNYLTAAERDDLEALRGKIRDELANRRRHYSFARSDTELRAERDEQDMALAEANADMQEQAEDVPLEFIVTPEDLVGEGLEPSTESAVIVDLLAQLPEEERERLSIEYGEASEAEFLAALRRTVKESGYGKDEDAEAAPGGEQGGRPAGEGARAEPAQDADAAEEEVRAAGRGQEGGDRVEQPLAQYTVHGEWTGEPRAGVIRWVHPAKKGAWGEPTVGYIGDDQVVTIKRDSAAKEYRIDIKGWRWNDDAPMISSRERAMLAAERILAPAPAFTRVAQARKKYDVETVQPGEKGTQRQRTDKAIKKYLQAKRPGEKDTQRIISYRTEATVGYNNAVERGAPQDVLDFLQAEHDWAMARLKALAPEVYAELRYGDATEAFRMEPEAEPAAAPAKTGEKGALFIPLKSEFYEAFEKGIKTTEYRKYGGPWTEKNVYPGRRVIISKGYGKGARRTGTVTEAKRAAPPADPAWKAIYGDATDAFHITIKLDDAPAKGPREWTPHLYPPASEPEHQVRKIAHGIKNGDRPAIDAAAKEMAAAVSPDDILIPIPGRYAHGNAENGVHFLTEAIGKLSGATVIDMTLRNVKGRPSQYERKKQGRPMKAEDMPMEWLGNSLADDPSRKVWLVDNVMDTGETMKAARAALGRDASPLVYARTGAALELQPAPAGDKAVPAVGPEEQAAAIRDRNEAVLTPPAGTAPPAELKPQPTQQSGLFTPEEAPASRPPLKPRKPGEGGPQGSLFQPRGEYSVNPVKALEQRFGSDEALGVDFSDEDQSRFPDGRSATNCTACAAQVVRALGPRAQIWGFAAEDMETVSDEGRSRGKREYMARIAKEYGGHDFAIVDGRYLVDPWIKLVAAELNRSVFDLENAKDAALVERWYGPRENWSRLEEAEQQAGWLYDDAGNRVSQLEAGYSALSAVRVKLPVIEAETGRTVEIEEPAGAALREIDGKIKTLRELRECLLS